MNTRISTINLFFKVSFILGLISGVYSQCSIQNCGKCSPDNQICYACLQGYEKDIYGMCIQPSIQNCNFLGAQNNCLRCNPTYKVSQNNNQQCIKDLSGCIDSDIFGNCKQCGFSTSMISGAQCSGVINCQNFALDNCPKCRSGYQLRNNICVDITQSCSTTDPNNGVCLSCRPGFKMIGFTCFQINFNIPYCLLYENASCSICKDSLIAYQGKCMTQEEISKLTTLGQAQQNTFESPQVQSAAEVQQNDNNNMDDNGISFGFSSFQSDGFGFGGFTSQFSNTGFTSNFQSGFVSNFQTTSNSFNTQTNNAGSSETMGTSTMNNNDVVSNTSTNNSNSNLANQQNTTSTTTTSTTSTTTSTSNTQQESIIPGTSSSGVSFDFSGQGLSFGGFGGNQNFDNGFNSGSNVNFQTFNPTFSIDIQFCEKYDDNNQQICVRCQTGYYPRPPNRDQCVLVSQFCDGYRIQNGDCIGCLYELTLQNGKCVDKNCLSYSGQICSNCEGGYLLDYQRNICIYLDPNCYQFSTNKICIQCNQRFYLNKTNRCVPLPPNCVEIDENSGLCKICDENYQIVNGFCSQAFEIQNCNQVNKALRTCIICEDRYYLSQNQQRCLKVSQYCQNYSQMNGLCLSCPISQLKLQNGICLDPNCLFPNPQSIGCLQCNNGYNYQQSDSICVKIPQVIIENCQSKVPNNQNFCQVCSRGYYVDNNYQCSILPQNCQEAFPNGQCNSCVQNFIKIENQCVPKITIANCLTVNQNTKTCIECDRNYITRNGQCFEKSETCRQYSLSTGLCLICQPNYYQNQNSQCINLPNNCIQAFSNGTCRQCRNGYISINNVCTQNVDNCLQLISENRCGQCINGLYVNNQGLCSQLSANCFRANFDGFCLQCISGYFVNNDGTCIQNILNCQMMGVGGFCRECSQGFYLNMNGSCSILPQGCQQAMPLGFCTRCKSGYNINNQGLCIQQIVIENCDNISQNNQCLKCFSGYYVNTNGKCSSVPSNCLDAHPIGVCKQCIQNYYISISGQCRINLPNCQMMSVSGFCQRCIEGYYQNFDGACLKLPEGCENATPNGFCSKCLDSYINTPQGLCLKAQMLSNCLSSNNQKCIQCDQGYYLNAQDKCSQLPINCQAASRTGICNRCSIGYSFNGNICVRTIVNCLRVENNQCQQCSLGYYTNTQGFCSLLPQNCEQANSNSACFRCITGYYLNLSNQCMRNPNNCQSVNPNGNCMRCNQGFIVNNEGICVVQNNIPNCAQIVNRMCSRCSNGYYVNINRSCSVLPDFCALANFNGICTSCYSGYTLNSSNICVLTSSISISTTQTLSSQQSIQFCQVYNGNLCSRCSDRYFPIFDNRRCAKVPDSCLNYNISNGICQSCKNGFTLLQIGVCLNLTSAQNREVDRNCIRYGTSGFCQRCSRGFYFSEIGICIPVNPLCQTSNVHGLCTSCYPGYTYGKGFCILSIASSNNSIKDENCKTYNNTARFCSQCYSGYYYNSQQQKCLRANPLCATSNSQGGCSSCYPSYVLIGTLCQNSQKDPYCKSFNSQQMCTQCSNKYYMDSNNQNKCTPVDVLCSNYSKINGKCTSCYQGYALMNQIQIMENGRNIITGDCQLGGSNSNSDTNCRKFTDNTRSFCSECYSGFFPLSGVCSTVNPLCKSFNSMNGFCTQCYQGYTLIEGQCLLSTQLSTQQVNDDPYCIKFSNGICIQCSQGFFFNRTAQQCTLLDPYCKSHNLENGDCLTCYQGFVISGIKCVLAGSQNTQSAITIENCQQYQNNRCVRCYPRYYFNQAANKCEAVSTTCLQYNSINGKCLSCVSGFYYQDNQCVKVGFFDINCQRYQSAYCSKCNQGYYLTNYYCTKIHQNCIQFDYSRNTCNRCSGSSYPDGSTCIQL